MDIKKAFDSADKGLIFKCLYNTQTPSSIIKILEALLMDLYLQLIYGLIVLYGIPSQKGIKLGDKLPPLLFNLKIHTITKQLIATLTIK